MLLRYRLLKIAGIPPGFSRLYLSEIMTALKLRMPNIVVGAAWNEPDLASLVHCGAAAVGLALPFTAAGQNPVVSQSDLVTKIRGAAECAHAGKKPFFVEDVIERDLAVRLCAVGVDNISSPTIWKPIPEPSGILPWSASQLAA